MVNKTIEIEGYGTIVFNPINFKDKEYENVDIEGNPLEWVSGSATRGHFVNSEGNEVPSSQVRKKVEVEGETILMPKLTPTSKVEMDDVEVSEDNSEIYSAIDRKAAKVFTDSKKLNKLILEENKTLKFPLTLGTGYKMHNGILTNWKGQIGLFGCRGNIDEAFEKYQDEVVDIEIEMMPTMDKKKLLKAMAV